VKKILAVAFVAMIIGILTGIGFVATLIPSPVHAQSIGVSPIAATASACPLSVSGQWLICGYGSASTGYAFCGSFNGGACVPLSSGTVGVTSFNGRTGAVVPTAADYSFAQLSGTATTAQLPALVNSFNGRTGNVLPASADYSFSLVSGTATVGQLPTIPFSQLSGQIAPTQVPAIITTVTSTATTSVQ
jgi:hypothetical protein